MRRLWSWLYGWLALVVVLINLMTFCYWQPMWAHRFRTYLFKKWDEEHDR